MGRRSAYRIKVKVKSFRMFEICILRCVTSWKSLGERQFDLEIMRWKAWTLLFPTAKFDANLFLIASILSFFMYRLSGRSSAYRIQINKPKCSSPKDHNIITKALPQHHHTFGNSSTALPTKRKNIKHETRAPAAYHQNICTQPLSHHQDITETQPKHHQHVSIQLDAPSSMEDIPLCNHNKSCAAVDSGPNTESCKMAENCFQRQNCNINVQKKE